MKKILLLIILMFAIGGQAMAQRKVTGHISDKTGEPVIGATIIVKGSTSGAISDLDGNYEITVPGNSAILVFTYIGMMPQEITVGENIQIDVVMEEETQTLDEVVVIGYGTVKRANLAGAVTDINAEELNDIPVSNLSAALEAKLPGVRISLPSGNPLSSTSIQIRANTTFSDIGEPAVYVIDGILRSQEAFDILDPNEVESISVLKDASASVYGAASAGGVILVKTKKGRIGKLKMNYSGSYGFSQPINTTEMLSAYEHAVMLNDGYEILGISSKDPRWISEDVLTYLRDSLPGGGYDWMGGFWNNSSLAKHNLSFSGGTDAIRYYFGGNFVNDNGNIANLYSKKYTLRSSIEVTVAKGLTASIETSIGLREGNTPRNPLDGSQFDLLNETFRALLTNPKWIPPTIDDKLVYVDNLNNPYVLLDNNSYKNNKANSVNYIAALNYQTPIKGLSLGFQFSQSFDNYIGKEYNGISYAYKFQQSESLYKFDLNAPLDSLNPKKEIQGQEYLQENAENGKKYQGNARISYSRVFGRHDFKAMAVCEFGEGYGYKIGWKKATDQLVEGYDLEWAFADDNSGYTLSLPSYSQSASLSYIGRLNYIYDDRYITEFSFRYESSILFPTSNRWGFFPSLLVGWVVSEEPFFEQAKNTVNFMKFRGSVGRLGNMASNNPFLYMLVYAPSSSSYLFGDTPSFTVEAKQDAFINEDVEWQKTDSYNLGLDMRLFNNKISFTADAFYKYTFDILEPISSRTPTTVGIASNNKVKFNYGAMHAYGYEMDLGYHNNIAGEFRYDIRLIFAWSEAMILKKAQALGAIGTWHDETINPTDNQPGWISSGIIRTDEELQDILMDNPNYSTGGTPLDVGMLNYLDIRGTDGSEGPNGVFNGSIDEDRTTIANRTNPPYTYGTTVGFEWKGFRINTTLSGQFGHYVFYDKESMVNPTSLANVPAFWADHWTAENINAAYPRALNYGGEGQYSTFWRRDGHTLRVSDINISYSLPSRWIEKIGFNTVRAYINSKYLWTIINPLEYKDAYLSRYNGYPMTRNYVFGINFGF